MVRWSHTPTDGLCCGGNCPRDWTVFLSIFGIPTYPLCLVWFQCKCVLAFLAYDQFLFSMEQLLDPSVSRYHVCLKVGRSLVPVFVEP